MRHRSHAWPLTLSLLAACAGDSTATDDGATSSASGSTTDGTAGSTSSSASASASTGSGTSSSSSASASTSSGSSTTSESTSVGTSTTTNTTTAATTDATTDATGDTSGDTTGDPSTTGGGGGEPACDAGGQEAGSNGAEAPFGEAVVGLCRMALGCPTIWTLGPPPEGYKFKGTPNHKLLWRVWYYGWSQLEGTPAQLDEARSMLLDFFDTQLVNGHQSIGNANEVLTASHYQIWANGTTCARLLAVHHQDPALLDATGRWWRGEKALLDALERGGSIDAPGARFKDGQAGPNMLRNTIYAMIVGAPLSGNAAKPNSPWWDDYYNVAAWTLREIQRLGDDLGGAKGAGPADLPNLRDPLTLYSQGDDYVFVFDKMRGALEPIFWSARIGGQAMYSPYIGGTPVDNPFPPPVLQNPTVQVIPGSP